MRDFFAIVGAVVYVGAAIPYLLDVTPEVWHKGFSIAATLFLIAILFDDT